MGNILTVASGKGGCSKTSTVMLLSANLAAQGYRVAVIDADRNQSFASWHAQAYEGPEFTCRSEIDHIKVVDLAGELSESHDVVLVDTAGFESLTAASAIGMADFVIIPCMPDRGSVCEAMWTTQQVASLSRRLDGLYRIGSYSAAGNHVVFPNAPRSTACKRRNLRFSTKHLAI